MIGFWTDDPPDPQYTPWYQPITYFTESSGWQCCPVCNGTGQDPAVAFNACPICDGKRIISKDTGKPPLY